MSMNPARCIVYISSATTSYSLEEMSLIKDQLRRDFAARQLSGIVIYAGGNLLCMIEDPETAVVSTYEEGKKDVRHHGLVKLHDAASDMLYFQDFGLTFMFLHSFGPLNDYSSPERQAYLAECLDIEDKPMRRLNEFLAGNNYTLPVNLSRHYGSL